MKIFRKIAALIFLGLYFVASQPGFCACTLIELSSETSEQSQSHTDCVECSCTICTPGGFAAVLEPVHEKLPRLTSSRLRHAEQSTPLEKLAREIFVPPKLG